jgi:choline dehydrogenase
MIYQRATKGTMDMWAKQIGDDSYSWEKFLPHYQKSVNFTAPKSTPRAGNATAKFRAEAFLKGGPLSVSYANYAGPFSSWIQGSLNEIGIPSTDDFNSGSLMGAQYCSSTIDPVSQSRESSETSFLNAAKGRKNLKVYTGTRAKKILFDARLQATGVTVQGSTTPYNISAKREVIVSAGAFQSPQILMVSGIGPKAMLDQFKIPILKDLPAVGQGMEVNSTPAKLHEKLLIKI